MRHLVVHNILIQNLVLIFRAAELILLRPLLDVEELLLLVKSAYERLFRIILVIVVDLRELCILIKGLFFIAAGHVGHILHELVLRRLHLLLQVLFS